jgi:hypothetical protein
MTAASPGAEWATRQCINNTDVSALRITAWVHASTLMSIKDRHDPRP